MTDKENKTQTTDISNSRLGVLGENTRIEGDIRGDDISADGRDIAVAKDSAHSTIIKIGKMFQQRPLITSATALLLLILIAAISGTIWFQSIPPQFTLVKSTLRSDAPIIIEAVNWKADRNSSVNVEFDEILFNEKGIPLEKDTADDSQKWQFVLMEQDYTQEMLNQGYHRIRVGFPGGKLSCSDGEGCKIVFINSPPVIKVESRPGQEPDARIIEGQAASEIQVPGNEISVEIFYYHDGQSQEINVPVTVKEEPKTGITYFEFETTVQGLPHILPDDPGYSEPFFGFKITDMAGNTYFQEQSYAQYMAPGCSRFGFDRLARMKVEKLEKDDEFKNIFRMTPAQIPLQNQLPGGEPAIVLNVTGRTLKWRSNVKNRLPVTVIFQDEKQIGTSLTDEYKVDEKASEAEVAYRVEQEDENGVKYTSNMVKSSGKIEIEPFITNAQGMKFVYIPPGKFMMGSPEKERDRNDDELLHEVEITNGYYMQTTEVTQGQWKAVMGSYSPELFFTDCGDNCPVEKVSWNDVTEFIKALNQFGKSRYRLPTEAEWEYACRAGSSTAYYFGNSTDKLKEYAWFLNNSDGKTHPVAQLKPNKWGLYDMRGNVWEWCQDWYGKDYYSKSPSTNPTGPDNGSLRVFRGGCWAYPPWYCRAAYRYSGDPDSRDSRLGFRLCLPGQQSQAK